MESHISTSISALYAKELETEWCLGYTIQINLERKKNGMGYTIQINLERKNNGIDK